LTTCILEVEQIEAKVNNSKKKTRLTIKEEEQEKEGEIPTTLDGFFITNSGT
jgi:hypothetical protein